MDSTAFWTMVDCRLDGRTIRWLMLKTGLPASQIYPRKGSPTLKRMQAVVAALTAAGIPRCTLAEMVADAEKVGAAKEVAPEVPAPCQPAAPAVEAPLPGRDTSGKGWDGYGSNRRLSDSVARGPRGGGGYDGRSGFGGGGYSGGNDMG